MVQNKPSAAVFIGTDPVSGSYYIELQLIMSYPVSADYFIKSSKLPNLPVLIKAIFRLIRV